MIRFLASQNVKGEQQGGYEPRFQYGTTLPRPHTPTSAQYSVAARLRVFALSITLPSKS